MGKLRYLTTSLIAILLMGCTQKSYKPDSYTPISLSPLPTSIKGYTKHAISFNREGYAHNRVHTPQAIPLKKGEYLLFANKDISVIAKAYTLLIKNGQNINGQDITQTIPLKALPISATVANNLLAVILQDNSFQLWHIDDKTLLFSKKEAPIQGMTYDIAAPIITEEMVVIPFLNRNIGFYNHQNSKFISSVNLGTDMDTTAITPQNLTLHLSNFTDMIYFPSSPSKTSFTLIATTKDQIFSLHNGTIYKADPFIKPVAMKYIDGELFVSSLEGSLYRLNKRLKTLQKVYYPYAKFRGWITHKDRLYVVEEGGYIIWIDKNSLQAKQIYYTKPSIFQTLFRRDKTLTVGQTAYFKNGVLDTRSLQHSSLQHSSLQDIK